jgi:CHAT domain-containing protein
LGPSDIAGSSFSNRYADIYHEAIDLLAELGREGEAFDVLERSRAQSFLTLLAARDLTLSSEIPAEVEERRRLRFDRERASLALAHADPTVESTVKALRARLAEIRSHQERLEEEIRSVGSRSSHLRLARVLGHRAALRSLDSGTVLVAFSVGERRTLAFVAGAGRPLVLRPLPASAAELEKLVSGLLDVVSEVRSGATGKRRRRVFEATAAELYDRLIVPIADLLKGGKRLLVIADGPLHHLPFAALRPAGGGIETYLGRSWPIHVVSSVTVYSQLRSRLNPPATDPVVEVFGDPDYRLAPQDTRALPIATWTSQRGSAWLAPLPKSRDEARRVASLFPAARLWLGREATEERAKAVGVGTSYVHFACHATLDERFPLESALVLSLPADVSKGSDNGLLQAWEIFEQMRLGADLVVLSACSSAGGQAMGGEGLIGLTRAFQYAGARSVLASLWPVTDGATSVFMGRFYEHLRQGLSKDRALQATQNEAVDGRLRGDAGQDLSSPFYWSAFQLIGDYR